MVVFKKYKIIFLIGISFLGGLMLGSYAGFQYEKNILDTILGTIHPLRENSAGYSFINPLLAYSIPSSNQDADLLNIKNKILTSISLQKKNGLQKASVFLSDLNRGRWIGINENEQYPPASMFKVVIMVAYLKGSEQVPGLLDEMLLYTNEIAKKTDATGYNPQTSLKIGNRYSVTDLINRMIVDSDNGAELLLLNSMDQKFFDVIFKSLNIQGFSADGNFTISPKEYSLFFRIIYSATYLRPEVSEQALVLLSQTTFDEGLVVGVPETTLVAHKFGEYIFTENGKVTDLQLHDCGIIYYPENPYFLCVMTKGDNLGMLKKTIQNISSIVYKNYK